MLCDHVVQVSQCGPGSDAGEFLGRRRCSWRIPSGAFSERSPALPGEAVLLVPAARFFRDGVLDHLLGQELADDLVELTRDLFLPEPPREFCFGLRAALQEQEDSRLQ